MLQLRPSCECCDTDLPPDSTSAMICSFECTFCASCAVDRLNGRCPNCGGNLTQRPARTGTALNANPASDVRVVKPGGCEAGYVSRAPT